MADCDICGEKQYRDALLGPKRTALQTSLVWICPCCRGDRPRIEYVNRYPLPQFYPLAGLAALTVIVLAVLLVVFGG